MFPKIRVPQNGWFIMESPIKMDDLGGYHYFWKHPDLKRLYGTNTHITWWLICWFGALWFGIQRVPLSNNAFHRGDSRNPNHRAPNQQVTSSWHTSQEKKQLSNFKKISKIIFPSEEICPIPSSRQFSSPIQTMAPTIAQGLYCINSSCVSSCHGLVRVRLDKLSLGSRCSGKAVTTWNIPYLEEHPRTWRSVG